MRDIAIIMCFGLLFLGCSKNSNNKQGFFIPPEAINVQDTLFVVFPDTINEEHQNIALKAINIQLDQFELDSASTSRPLVLHIVDAGYIQNTVLFGSPYAGQFSIYPSGATGLDNTVSTVTTSEITQFYVVIGGYCEVPVVYSSLFILNVEDFNSTLVYSTQELINTSFQSNQTFRLPSN